jgi:hypothetical protein
MSQWIGSKHFKGNGEGHELPWLYNPEQIARSLGKAKRSGDNWVTNCPAHDDRNASLSIGQKNGKILVKCHAGCSQDAVIEAMRARGAWPSDKKQPPPRPPERRPKPAPADAPEVWEPIVPPPRDAVAPIPAQLRCEVLHEYRDADDRLLFYVRRHEHNGSKSFVPLVYGRLGGKLAWHERAANTPRPLYGLNRLAHADAGATVLICEGEKAADAAGRIFPDYIALTWAGGANAVSTADWTPLNGRAVVIWPDADAPGARAATQIAAILPRARIVDTAGLPEGFDAADLEASSSSDEREGWLDARLPQPPRRPADPFLLFADIKPAIDTADFVEDLLTTSSFVVVYGEPGSRKTFWVLDLCLHVASGRQWNGLEVDHGAVIYCALEGGAGIRNRVAAAQRRLGLPSDTAFVLLQMPLDLRDPDADSGNLIEIIRQISERLALPVRMVVIDTLSRALNGGNENGPEDMGALIGNADRIRFETGACVLFIHHCGKDAARGSRGHSSLKAATDTEIEIITSEDGASSIATVIRQRDLEIGSSFNFSLDVVALGTNRRGKPITSCVVAPARAGTRPQNLTGDKARAYDLLTNAVAAEGQLGAAGVPPGIRSVSENTWRDAFYAGAMPGQKQDTKRKAFERATKSLVSDLRVVGMGGGHVWLARGAVDSVRDSVREPDN